MAWQGRQASYNRAYAYGEYLTDSETPNACGRGEYLGFGIVEGDKTHSVELWVRGFGRSRLHSVNSVPADFNLPGTLG